MQTNTGKNVFFCMKKNLRCPQGSEITTTDEGRLKINVTHYNLPRMISAFPTHIHRGFSPEPEKFCFIASVER